MERWGLMPSRRLLRAKMNFAAETVWIVAAVVIGIALLVGAVLLTILGMRWTGWLADARQRNARWHRPGVLSIRPGRSQPLDSVARKKTGPDERSETKYFGRKKSAPQRSGSVNRDATG